MVLVLFGASTGMTANRQEVLTKGEAIQIGRKFVSEFTANEPLLDGYSIVSTPIMMETISGEPAVYLLNLNKQGSTGYLLVGANKNNMSPIVSLGFNDALKNIIKARKIATHRLGNNKAIGNFRLLYGGPQLLAVEFTVAGDREQNKIILDLMNLQEIDPKNFPTPDQDKDFTHIETGWSYYLNNSNEETNFSILITSTRDLSVRSYDQNLSNGPSQGCGPAAGAMMLNWWDERGYTLLQVDSDRTTGVVLMNHLFSVMSTNTFGTTIENFRSGLVKHTQNSGYSNFTSQIVNWSTGRDNVYNVLQSEVNNNRPVGLYYPLGATPYSYHYVAGRGYSQNLNTGERLYKVNTWGTSYWHNLNETSTMHLIYLRP